MFLSSLPHQIDGHLVDLGLDHVIRPLHVDALRGNVDDVIALGYLEGDAALLVRGRRLGAILVEPHTCPFDQATVVHDRELELCLGCLQVEDSEGGLARKHLDRFIGFVQDQNLASSRVDAVQVNEVLALGNASKRRAAFDVPGLEAPFALAQPV